MQTQRRMAGVYERNGGRPGGHGRAKRRDGQKGNEAPPNHTAGGTMLRRGL